MASSSLSKPGEFMCKVWYFFLPFFLVILIACNGGGGEGGGNGSASNSNSVSNSSSSSNSSSNSSSSSISNSSSNNGKATQPSAHSKFLTECEHPSSGDITYIILKLKHNHYLYTNDCKYIYKRLNQGTEIDISSPSYEPKPAPTDSAVDASVLKEFNHIKTFKANNSRIADISFLSEFKSLETVEIKNTLVKTLPAFSNLKTLDISGTKITSLAPINKVAKVLAYDGVNIDLNTITSARVSVFINDKYRYDGYDINDFNIWKKYKYNDEYYDFYGNDYAGNKYVDPDKYDDKGFDKKNHLHKDTNKKYNLQGKDYNGNDVYDNNGFHVTTHIHKTTHLPYDAKGKNYLQRDVYDSKGFQVVTHIHKDTNQLYNYIGYDYRDFDINGIHQNGTLFDNNHFDIRGFKVNGTYMETGNYDTGHPFYLNADNFKDVEGFNYKQFFSNKFANFTPLQVFLELRRESERYNHNLTKLDNIISEYNTNKTKLDKDGNPILPIEILTDKSKRLLRYYSSDKFGNDDQRLSSKINSLFARLSQLELI